MKASRSNKASTFHQAMAASSSQDPGGASGLTNSAVSLKRGRSQHSVQQKGSSGFKKSATKLMMSRRHSEMDSRLKRLAFLNDNTNQTKAPDINAGLMNKFWKQKVPIIKEVCEDVVLSDRGSRRRDA